MLISELIAKNEVVKNMVEKANKEIEESLQEALQDFLSKNPVIKEIRWTQYTPYFNDGEPCVFGIRDIYFSTVKRSEDDLDEGDDFWEGDKVFFVYASYERYKEELDALGVTKETFEACQQLESLLYNLEDPLENLFGDHVEVIVTSKGVEVDDYDHD